MLQCQSERLMSSWPVIDMCWWQLALYHTHTHIYIHIDVHTNRSIYEYMAIDWLVVESNNILINVCFDKKWKAQLILQTLTKELTYIVFFLTWYWVTADFSILDGRQIPESMPKHLLQIWWKWSRRKWFSQTNEFYWCCTIKYNKKNISTVTAYILSISSFSSSAPGKSLLLPNTSTGIPANWGLSNKLCSSFLDASIFSASAASTIYLLMR